jgi:lysosomal-associated membrane protein 1/2
LDATLKIPYNNTTLSVHIPVDADHSESSCEDESVNLQFKYNGTNPFTLVIQFLSTKDTYSVSNITLKYTLDAATSDATSAKPVTVVLVENGADFLKADLNHSLTCGTTKDVFLTGPELPKDTKVVLAIEKIQMQAYMTKENNSTFSDSESCDASSTRDIVPIAVGCALVGLVVIVLVAYLIGRRRSRQQGYQSV